VQQVVARSNPQARQDRPESGLSTARFRLIPLRGVSTWPAADRRPPLGVPGLIEVVARSNRTMGWRYARALLDRRRRSARP
jgi:hypothetical protein